MAEFEKISSCNCGFVTPSPTNAYGAVVKVANIAVPNRTVACVKEGNADASRKKASATAENTVLDAHMVRVFFVVFRRSRIANVDAACTQVAEEAVRNTCV